MSRIIVKCFIASKDATSSMQVSVLKDLESIFKGRVEFEYLNSNDNESQASKYRIKEIPTIIIEFEGRERERFSGLTQQRFLKKAIQKNLSECR